MTSAPPGWKPHQIVTRVDGWIVDPENEDRIPTAVAEIISRAMPQVDGNTVADIRARMLARHKQVVGYV
jgi:uncharacterized membrane-anchored protein YjiN (DUF445 family)